MGKQTQQITLFWLRNSLIIGQLLVWLMNKYIWNTSYPNIVLLLIGFFFVINIFSRKGSKYFKEKYLFIHLLIDVFELSIFFYLTGGATNPFTWFLLIPIIFSATVLKQKYTWILTIISILSYSLLIKFFQPVSMSMDMLMSGHQHQSNTFGQHLIGMWVGFIVISILIAWVLVGLIKNIRRKDQLLMQADIKQAENAKIIALATLATGSAHELGTPLATINIIVKELLNNPNISEHHKVLSIVESQIYRCKDSLTKITASTGTTQAIDGSVEDIEVFLGRIKALLTHPKNINFSFSGHSNTNGKLLIDKTLIQAMVNMITNAFESEAKNVDVIYEKYNDSLLITIADDGKGLRDGLSTEHKSEKEFGMGLGLFLARATIERFTGTIRVNNYQTKGTQLEVKLPLVQS